MKTLVAYFSATGTTERVAKDLAAVTGGTLYEIKPEVKYTEKDLDWTVKTSRSSIEMQDRSSRPAIVKDLKDADGYDVVYIGFPVWWYTAPTIINTFIETYGFKGKTVIFFATSGGSSIDKANTEFKAQYPGINWKAGKTLNRASKADIKTWVESLGIARISGNALTPRLQGLAVIAALEAKGDQAGLEAAVAEALDKGLTISEAKEALSQLYAYTGFPRSLNALGTLQRVLEQRKGAGIQDNPGEEAAPLPADYDALKQGTAVQTQLTGKPFNYSFVPATDYYLKAHLFGDIFARNNLSFSDREIVTVSAISALPGCEPQLIAHVSGARNMGVSDAELRALPGLLEQKVGLAEAERLRGALQSVLGDPHTAVQTVDFSIWPKGQPNTAYAKFFTGDSYLAQMGGGMANVTFEPGCRNNWHIHHKQVQVLICVAGRGWYQEWGKPAVQLVPGVIIEIPEGVKHWHGAAKDSWMQHLTYHKDVLEGASNEWLEAVSDADYAQAGN